MTLAIQKLLALALLALVIACATPSKNYAAKKAYDTLGAYVLLIENQLDRGRIDKATATQRMAQVKDVKAKVEAAEAALAGCKAEPCDGTSILKTLQPMLIEYERELQAQGATK